MYLGIQSGQLFPPIEHDYHNWDKIEVDDVDLAINFSLIFYHLLNETIRLNESVKQLEKRRAFSQKHLTRLIHE